MYDDSVPVNERWARYLNARHGGWCAGQDAQQQWTFEQGDAAFVAAGKANPYPSGSEWAKYWIEGWVEGWEAELDD
jgi:hypothetical protein